MKYDIHDEHERGVSGEGEEGKVPRGAKQRVSDESFSRAKRAANSSLQQILGR